MKQFITRAYSIALVAVMVLLLSCGALLGSCSSSTSSATSAQASSSSISQASSSSASQAAKTSPKKESGSPTSAASSSSATSRGAPSQSIDENGEYSDKDSVALYIHTYGHLPSNYISKTKARKAGWDSTKGNLWDVLPGKSIGGSEFYNDDGVLPDKSGRRWTECDIDYNGGYRGAKRIVFSNDGLIFYTADHYETFEQLY